MRPEATFSDVLQAEPGAALRSGPWFWSQGSARSASCFNVEEEEEEEGVFVCFIVLNTRARAHSHRHSHTPLLLARPRLFSRAWRTVIILHPRPRQMAACWAEERNDAAG